MLRIEQYQLEQWQSQRYLCVLRQVRDLYAVLFAVKKLNALMHIYDADAFALLNHIRVQCSLDGLHTFGLNAHTIIPYAYLQALPAFRSADADYTARAFWF